MNQALGKRLFLGLALGALVYLGLAVYSGWHDLEQAASLFQWPLLGPVLLLSSANYLIRFLRWHLYLRRANVRIDTWMSLRIFLCGLVMSVTPGKLGEVFKAYLVKMQTGAPVTRTGPIIIAERVTDLLALVLLLFIGSLIYRSGGWTVVASGGVTLLLVVALMSPHVTRVVLHLVERIPWLRKYGLRIEHAYVSMRSLLSPGQLVQATLLGTLAWFAECLGFALVCHGFGIAEPVARTTFIYASATLLGALLLLPGGLGGTEASMWAFLIQDGAPKQLALAATFVTRIATLWFAVLVGALVLLSNRRLTVEEADLG